MAPRQHLQGCQGLLRHVDELDHLKLQTEVEAGVGTEPSQFIWKRCNRRCRNIAKHHTEKEKTFFSSILQFAYRYKYFYIDPYTCL